MKKTSTLTAIATAAIAATTVATAPAHAEQQKSFWMMLKERIAGAQANAAANPETATRGIASQHALSNHY